MDGLTPGVSRRVLANDERRAARGHGPSMTGTLFIPGNALSILHKLSRLTGIAMQSWQLQKPALNDGWRLAKALCERVPA
jgi:hypothetical protein